MVMFRMVLAIVLVSSSVVMSMESEYKGLTIQRVLDTFIKPYQERSLDDIQLVTLYCHCGGNIKAKGTVSVGANGQKISRITLLMASVCYDRPKLMKFLINKCYARLDCVNEQGDTALHIAAESGRASMARVLLASGADNSIRNNYKRTALEEAYNSSRRYHPFYNTKHCYYNKNGRKKWCRNYHFPTMINLLERYDTRNIPQLLITQH